MVSDLLSKEVECLPCASAAINPSMPRKGSPLCLTGTREAVLNITDIWLNSSSHRMLVLKGTAGTGKSTIARTIATVVTSQHRLAASFFFSKHDSTRNSPNLFFPTIARQLAQHTKEFATHITNALQQLPDIAHKPLHEQLENLIVKPLGNINQKIVPFTLLIILDGLDECEREGAKQILRLLVNGLPNLPSYLKILITTRPEATFQPILDSLSAQERIHLDQMESVILESEVRRFLQRQLSQPKIQESLPECKFQLKQEDLDKLVMGAGRSFLVSAVIEKFIKDAKIRKPQRQLEVVLESMEKASNTRPPASSVLGYQYTLLLDLAFPATVPSLTATEDFRSVVGTIVVLEASLPLRPLFRLLDMDLDSAKTTLGHLAIFSGLSEDEICPFIRHSSFIDFITTPSRCEDTRFLIKPAVHHQQVAGRCFDVMTRMLKRNICQIPPSDQHARNDAVTDLKAKVKEHIPQELEYACCHWASHSSKAPSSFQPVLEMVERFAFEQLPFWLEALSLTDHVDKAHPALQLAEEYTTLSGTNGRLNTMLNDALRFIMTYQPIIEISALHIYYSALSFFPPNSLLSEAYAAETANSIRVLSGSEGGGDDRLLTLKGHTSCVYSIAFSPDSTQLASASGDTTVRLWNATTGSPIAVLNDHTDEVFHVKFSPDGTLLVSTSDDSTVRLWDVTTKALIATMEGHSQTVCSAIFSPDGTQIASGSIDQTVRLWDVATRAHKATLQGHTLWVRIVVFSPDGSQLASASGDSTVKIWDVGTGTNTLTLSHSSMMRTVVFSPDGSQLATGSDDCTVRLWDAVTGVHRAVLSGHSAMVWDVKFSPDGTRLASASADCTVRIWDAASGVSVVAKEHPSSVRSVAFSHDGLQLAASFEDSTLRIWDISRGIAKRHPTEVDCVTLSPDTTRVVTVSNSAIMLWDAVTGTYIAILSGNVDSMTPIMFSPDSTMLASPLVGNAILTWDTTCGGRKGTLEGHTDRVLDVVFSSNSKILASTSFDNTVRLWDLTTGSNLTSLESYSDQILCIAFSPDDTRLAAGSDNGSIQIWDAVAGARIATLEMHTGPVWKVVFSSHSINLASASDDGSAILWDVLGGAYVAELHRHSGVVLTVVFSPDGTHVASGSSDGIIRILENSSAPRVALLEGHSSWVWDVAFSSDGTRLASASSDLTIRIWDTNTSASLVTLDGYYCYPDLSGVFTNESVHLVKKHGYPALVRLHNHSDGTTTQTVICWLPPSITPTRSRSSNGVVVVGASDGRFLCLNATSPA